MANLLQLCKEEIVKRGLDNELYQNRLELEMRDIEAQNERDYFVDLYERNVRYLENEHNLLVPFLLGIVDNFDMAKEPSYDFGDWPDIDIDFSCRELQQHLKTVWAPKAFGEKCVCSITTYGTFGIKSALINMARVYGKNRKDVLDLTTTLGLKDEDGKTLTWETAMEMYPSLKKYCEENADVAKAAKRLINRNNTMGKHAGGLIISSVPLNSFVPLVKGKDGGPVSAWVEGLHGQDLGPMGLVKFDVLVITNLMQIAKACKLIKERRGVQSINALPGQEDWSDDAYLEDPEALAMANRGDLRCIFQFDSDGIRAIVKAGGVDCFNDLVAYNAIYRPANLQAFMHTSYIKRKKGEEDFEIHPLLKSILGKTYGVMVYQEQIMQILHVVGDIPLKDCEILRKAISKKIEDYFAKYKEMFITNGQKNLGWSKEKVEELWGQVEKWSGYGFNRSHAVAYSIIAAQLLWLKAHYPLEFFAAILSCEDDSEKIQEYKIEARRRNISVCPIDINKSGVRFQIADDCIYFGFANVKGIGEGIAEKIVQHQPYTDFKDFLMRFGTEAGVLKPLIGLRVFEPEMDTLLRYKYYEWFKDQKKKREDRRKRYEKNCEKMLQELQGYVGKDYTFADFVVIKGSCHEEEVLDLEKRYRRMVNGYNTKISEEKPLGESEGFKPEEIEIDDKLVAIYSSLEECEKQYYGFLWKYPVERSPDFNGDNTFEDHRATGGKNEDGRYLYVEGQVLSATRTESKNKKTIYWLLKFQDSQGEIGYIQVWSDDWERWSEELQEGALARMQLQPPTGGFRRYTLFAPPKWQRAKIIPKDKAVDFRVLAMRKEENG
jgi:DNA polymerase III alpha subunit